MIHVFITTRLLLSNLIETIKNVQVWYKIRALATTSIHICSIQWVALCLSKDQCRFSKFGARTVDKDSLDWKWNVY